VQQFYAEALGKAGYTFKDGVWVNGSRELRLELSRGRVLVWERVVTK